MSTELEKQKKDLPNKRSNYIANLVFDIIFLIVVNLLPGWNVSFLTDQFPAVLRIINVCIGIQASANLMLIMYKPLPLHHITQVVLSGVGFYLAYTLFTVFPFDFTSLGGPVGKALQFFPFRIVLKVLFGIGMAANGIKGIISLIKFAVSVNRDS